MNTVRTLEAFKKELMNYAYFRVMQAPELLEGPQLCLQLILLVVNLPNKSLRKVLKPPVITGSKDWFFPTSTHQLCWTEPFWGKKKWWIFFWKQSPESLIRQSRSHERLWRVFAKFHRKVIHRNWPNSVSGKKGCQSFDGLEKRDAVDRSIRKMNQENIRKHSVFKIHPEKSRGKQVLQ